MILWLGWEQAQAQGLGQAQGQAQGQGRPGLPCLVLLRTSISSFA